MDRQARILVVDDDQSFLRLLTLRLNSEGYETESVESAGSALKTLSTFNPDIVITDLRMDGMDGIGLLGELQQRSPGLPVLLLTAHGTIPDAVRATQTGAFAFLTKPIDNQELREKILDALRISAPTPADNDEWRARIVTRSPLIEEILATVERIAPTRSSVLVRGESGTGKELIAQSVHLRSGRTGQFVAFNCAAIPVDLLESEMFGYTRGAFTGASRDHAGLFQQADHGTLFLDEIGEMPAILQAKLLRVLEDQKVRPLGSSRTIDIDVRIVSATNKDLEQSIDSGEFRDDLYYRLNVITLTLPRLAERIEDIPLLASRCLKLMAERTSSTPKSFAPDAIALLVSHDWPGNVRQLFNVVEQTATLSSASVISADVVRKALGAKAVALPSLSEARDEFTRGYLLHLLAATEGNISQAARLAQRNRTDFYKLLARHDIDPASFKNQESAE
jgi:two-component system, NtrC family, response regulator GlrR